METKKSGEGGYGYFGNGRNNFNCNKRTSPVIAEFNWRQRILKENKRNLSYYNSLSRTNSNSFNPILGTFADEEQA